MNKQMSIDFQETRRYSIYNQSPNPLPPLLSHHIEDQTVFVIDLVDHTSVTHRPYIPHATRQKIMLCKSKQNAIAFLFLSSTSYRSTSPKTKSIVPMMATASASK